MKREGHTAQILDAKRKKGLSWKQIAEAIGPGSPILVYGRPTRPDDADKGKNR